MVSQLCATQEKLPSQIMRQILFFTRDGPEPTLFLHLSFLILRLRRHVLIQHGAAVAGCEDTDENLENIQLGRPHYSDIPSLYDCITISIFVGVPFFSTFHGTTV